eukprot:1142509-Pelagomonas_calceolata.AAC.2
MREKAYSGSTRKRAQSLEVWLRRWTCRLHTAWQQVRAAPQECAAQRAAHSVCGVGHAHDAMIMCMCNRANAVAKASNAVLLLGTVAILHVCTGARRLVEGGECKFAEQHVLCLQKCCCLVEACKLGQVVAESQILTNKTAASALTKQHVTDPSSAVWGC